MAAPIWVTIFGKDAVSPAFSKVMQKMDAVGQKMQQVGHSMSRFVTLPILAAGVMAVKTAADFETSMNRVQALTGATNTQIVSLTKQARELGATTQFSASQAADAMGFLAMAGFGVNKILGAMPDTLNLAAAAQMDLGETADLVTNIMTGYGKKEKDLTQVSDILVATFTKANTTLGELGEAMKFVAPVAKGAGVSFTEAAAAMGFLGNAGIKASMAGTSLRGIITKTINPTREAIKVFQKLGITKEQVLTPEGKLISLTNLLGKLGDAGATVGDLLEIAGQRAGPGMAALLDQGIGKFSEFQKTLEGEVGITARIAEVQMRGLNGQIKALRSAAEELALAIADTGLLTFITNLVRRFTLFLRNLAKTRPELLKIGVIVAAVAAAIGPLLIIVGSLVSAIAGLAPVLAASGFVILKVVAIVAVIVAAIVGFIAIVKKMKLGFAETAAGILTSANPIAGMAVWIMTRWERLLPFFRLFWKVFVEVAKVGIKAITIILWPLFKLFEMIGKSLFKILDLGLGAAEFFAKNILGEKLSGKFGFLPPEGGEKSAVPALTAEQVGSNLAGAQRREDNINLRLLGFPGEMEVEREAGDSMVSVEQGLLVGALP